MGFLDALRVSASGLAAERVRMNVISENIANANTTKTEDGTPYRRKDVVFTARDSGTRFDDLMRDAFDPEIKEVRVDGIIEDQRAPKMVFNPNHPHADENGFVAMPNISVMEEMVNMITATRAFEANVAAMNSTKQMASTAINIGRG